MNQSAARAAHILIKAREKPTFNTETQAKGKGVRKTPVLLTQINVDRATPSNKAAIMGRKVIMDRVHFWLRRSVLKVSPQHPHPWAPWRESHRVGGEDT